MGTPAYEAVKVGDTYKMVRVDPEHKANLSKLTVGGGLLALMGIARRGILGAGLVAAGGTLIYCGLAERDPDGTAGLAPAAAAGAQRQGRSISPSPVQGQKGRSTARG
jgi:tetrahydromethanopterin S-methyltransferase subunit D